MSAWPELERDFRAALLGAPAAAVEAAIAPDGLAPAARLAIYRHHVLTTLTDALRATYPVVCRLVDERFFRYAASEFIPAHPPAGPCLFEYGADLADFLAAFPPCRHLAYLPDVARLEWAMNVAGHAEDRVAVTPAALADVRPADAGRVTFRLHPALSLLASPWPVDRIWEANQPGADETVDLDAGPVRLEVGRRGDDVVVRRLDGATFAFRQALAAGRPLEVAAAAALAERADFELAGALGELFADGVAVAFTLSTPTRETS